MWNGKQVGYSYNLSLTSTLETTGLNWLFISVLE